MKKIVILLIIFGLFFVLFPTNIVLAVGSETLFSDGFEEGFNWWVYDTGTQGNFVISDTNPYAGVYHAYCKPFYGGEYAYMQYNISTVGYVVIGLSYYMKVVLFDDSDNCSVSWYNGKNWNKLYELGNSERNDGDYDFDSWILSSGAWNNKDFAIRFMVEANLLSEYIEIDNVKVTGYSNQFPNKPICILPPDDESNIDIDTTLKVTAIDNDNDNMNIRFYWSNHSLIETVTNVANNTYAETSSLSLDYNTTYSWYAVASDLYFENTSDMFSFTTLVFNLPPDKPTCVSPLNNSIDILTDTTLKTHVIDIDGNNMNVSFYWSDDTLIETIISVVNDTDIETSSLSLDYNTTYSWYVIVNDSLLQNTSDVFSFTTMPFNLPPDKPICISPIDKELNVNIDTTFKTKVIDADGDTLNVSFYVDDVFFETVVDVSNNTIVESSNLSLDYSMMYTWYVVVEDKYFLNTSDIFIFATEPEPEPIIPNIPPNKPVLISPVDNSVNISKFTRLKTHVDDLDDDFLYVKFYWENNSEIQFSFSIVNYTFQTAMLDLDYYTVYSWYVVVTDFVDYNISDIYTFVTEIEVIEDDYEPPTLELNYSILLIGIFLALIVFTLEFFSHKLKIKRTKLLSTVEFSLMIVIIFIMIFLKFV